MKLTGIGLALALGLAGVGLTWWLTANRIKPAPDFAKIGRLMKSFFLAIAAQGLMQMTIIVIMARFATGI